MADSISRITDTAGNAAVSLILSDEEKRKREASRRGTTMLGGLGHFASVSATINVCYWYNIGLYSC